MRISIIVATAKNRVIGRNGQLPWHLPRELQRFKQLTMGHTLLMGRQTFESIGRALPGRRIIVVSRDPNYRAQGCETVGDIPSGMLLARHANELFICGGAEIFRQTLSLAERIYLTELEVELEGDTFFPELPSGKFQTIQTQQFKDKINYRFSILQKKNNRDALAKMSHQKM